LDPLQISSIGTAQVADPRCLSALTVLNAACE
jgi:hypothetical protein